MLQDKIFSIWRVIKHQRKMKTKPIWKLTSSINVNIFTPVTSENKSMLGLLQKWLKFQPIWTTDISNISSFMCHMGSCLPTEYHVHEVIEWCYGWTMTISRYIIRLIDENINFLWRHKTRLWRISPQRLSTGESRDKPYSNRWTTWP